MIVEEVSGVAERHGQKNNVFEFFGGVAERPIAPVLKTGDAVRCSRVRISPPPPLVDLIVVTSARRMCAGLRRGEPEISSVGVCRVVRLLRSARLGLFRQWLQGHVDGSKRPIHALVVEAAPG